MPRSKRVTLGNHVYHVLNRAAGKALLFTDTEDYHAFEELLIEAKQRIPVKILAYCLMPNHWHLLIWTHRDGDISVFIKWLATTHAARWTRKHECVGRGAVYQSRFKSVAVECGAHLFWVWRYVERNALRANLVQRAEEWRWGSLWHRYRTTSRNALDEGPMCLPVDWIDVVNVPQTSAELEAFRLRMKLNQPFGGDGWLARKGDTYEKRKARGLTPTGRRASRTKTPNLSGR